MLRLKLWEKMLNDSVNTIQSKESLIISISNIVKIEKDISFLQGLRYFIDSKDFRNNSRDYIHKEDASRAISQAIRENNKEWEEKLLLIKPENDNNTKEENGINDANKRGEA